MYVCRCDFVPLMRWCATFHLMKWTDETNQKECRREHDIIFTRLLIDLGFVLPILCGISLSIVGLCRIKQRDHTHAHGSRVKNGLFIVLEEVMHLLSWRILDISTHRIRIWIPLQRALIALKFPSPSCRKQVDRASHMGWGENLVFENSQSL